jgi:hypothetical protein
MKLDTLSPLHLPDDVLNLHVHRDGGFGIVAVTVAGRRRGYEHTGTGATFAAAYVAACDVKAADDRKHEAGLAWRKAA